MTTTPGVRRPIKVVERNSSVAAAYCGRLLGMLGADVVRLEPSAGDPMRRAHPLVETWDGHEVSARFEYLNCFKRGVCLDATGEERVMRAADVVIDHVDGNPDRAVADYRRLSAGHPGLVYVAISGFGLTGPYRRYRTNDFIDFASGGYTYITGDPHREPVQGGGPWSGYLVGTTAAIATMTALRRRAQTGRGQLVDVGAMEAMAASHQWTVTLYTHQGVIKRRAGNMHAESFNPLGPVPCQDGWVSIGVATAPQWENFCLAIDRPELLIDDRFQTGGDRFDHADELRELMEPALLSMSAAELVGRCHEHHVPAGPVLEVPEVLDEPQLRYRRYWRASDRIGRGARMPERPFRLGDGDAPFREAPGLGEHTAEVAAALDQPQVRVVAPGGTAGTAGETGGGTKVLSGVRVLEFTIAWAGPLAGRWLADLGAEVIHLEHPTARGVGITGAGGFQVAERDVHWQWGQLPGPLFRSGIFPDADPGERPWNRQGLFNKMQRNKLSLCMDLKAPGAAEVLIDLVKGSDVVLDNFSPGAIRNLGLDYESLLRHNPRLIRVSLSGYGHSGPAQTHPSWGPILEAQSGMASVTGYEDGGPLKIGAALPDPLGGLHGVVAILAALDERDRTGKGCFVDVSQLETYSAIGGELYLTASATGKSPPRFANRSPDHAPQGVYPSAGDEAWIAISVGDDEEWRSLAGVLGGDMSAADLATVDGRRRRHDDIDAVIAEWTRGRDRFEAMAVLQARGVRASALMTNQDLVENEQIAARGFIAEWEQVDVGKRLFPGFPVHFEDPARIPLHSAPALGADNERILAEILGYPAGRIAELTAGRVVATRPE